jgi:hypothetical protein
MNEADWLASTKLGPLTQCLFRKFDPVRSRKLRLFGCACCRQIWHLLNDRCGQHAVEVAELHADGRANRKELADKRAVAFAAAEARMGNAGETGLYYAPRAAAQCTLAKASQAALHASLDTAKAAYYNSETTRSQPNDWIWGIDAEHGRQVPLFRDIFGNPFRPTSLDPAWLTWHDGTIPKLAQTLYEDRALPSGHLDNHLLAVLADALEDAGCSDPDILHHCRGPGPHVRGCWVVDLLLGKV